MDFGDIEEHVVPTPQNDPPAVSTPTYNRRVRKLLQMPEVRVVAGEEERSEDGALLFSCAACLHLHIHTAALSAEWAELH